MKISVILQVTDVVFRADTDTDCVILLIMPGGTDTALSPGCLVSVVTSDQLTTLTLTRCHSITLTRPAGLHSHQSPILLLRCPL